MPNFGNEPDSALEKTNAKFISRFQKMEKLALEKKPQSF
jgi:XTP/dITP diphosphohydrolase